MTKNEAILQLKNDFLFKVVYGSDTEESKFILKSLLNKILDNEDDPIVNIEYKNPFQLKENFDDKETILDIKAEADSKKLIDIEMQIVWSKDMISRLLAYHGALLREALQGGKDYARMKQTITICITDTNVFNNTSDFLNKFYFMEKDKHFLFTRHTKIYCIELPKVNADKRPVSELTPLETCLEYIKYASSQENDYVKELVHKAGKELEMTETILKKATSEERLREKAIAREKYLNDQIYWSHRYDHGYDDGFNDGSYTALTKIAKAMKSNNIPLETISKYTNLSIETIEDL